MARIRTIKPGFFTHEELFDLEQSSGLPVRLAYAGLWTCCDREGRFQWRPRTLKVAILPYDDIDFSRVLDALASRGFVVPYTSGTEKYGYVPSWSRHQFINNKESASDLPDPSQCQSNEQLDASLTRDSRELVAPVTGGVKEGKGREEDRKEIAPEDLAGSLPLNDGTEHQISKTEVSTWQRLYPAVDVVQALRAMKGWLLASPERRKTKRGINKFINSWLSREQDKPRGGNGQTGNTLDINRAGAGVIRAINNVSSAQAAIQILRDRRARGDDYGADPVGQPD